MFSPLPWGYVGLLLCEDSTWSLWGCSSNFIFWKGFRRLSNLVQGKSGGTLNGGPLAVNWQANGATGHSSLTKPPHSRMEILTMPPSEKSFNSRACWSGRVSKYPWCINPLHFPHVFDESSTFTFQVSLIMNCLCCLPEVMARVKWNSFWRCPSNHRMWKTNQGPKKWNPYSPFQKQTVKKVKQCKKHPKNASEKKNFPKKPFQTKIKPLRIPFQTKIKPGQKTIKPEPKNIIPGPKKPSPTRPNDRQTGPRPSRSGPTPRQKAAGDILREWWWSMMSDNGLQVSVSRSIF